MRLPRGHPEFCPRGTKCSATYCSLYGLKDAPRVWFKHIDNILKSFGLTSSVLDPCLYTNATHTLYVLMYVDDLLFMSSNSSLLAKFEAHLATNLEIKVTEHLTKYVGHEILRTEEGIYLHCSGYIKAIATKYGLAHSKKRLNPGTKGALLRNPESKELTGDELNLLYSLLGTANYIVHSSRPDAGYTANFIARAMGNPQ